MDKKLVRDLCKDALSTCNSINAHLITLQSRVELELPVDETARVIDQRMQTLDEQLVALGDEIIVDEMDEIMEDDADGC